MGNERITYENLLGISACVALALIAHLSALPLWVPVVVVVCALIRLSLARKGRGAPPRSVLLTVGGLAVALLFLRFHTFNGIAAGTALLSLMAGLKLLETQTKRDIYIITLIIYFVSLSALLEGESFFMLAYLIGVCWITTATLLRLTSAVPPPDWRRSARSPGDINHLALSDEVAFRVRYAAAVPPPQERYWRGPVLDEFDGHTWRRAYSGYYKPAALETQGPAYKYTVMMEPHQHNWIFTLDWPASWDLQRGVLSNDYTLMQPYALSRAIDVTATSYTHVQSGEALSAEMRRRNARPPPRNPRTLQLAQQMRGAHPGDMDYVRAVLEMFAQQPFYYTLNPPKLADNSVDEFLFDTKRGFCGHYASAFAALMRAAHIPARVVTGYHGGTQNPYADYWILRQSEAHAWNEVWIDGRGWIRIDPTSVIAPQRVELGAADSVNADEPLVSRWSRNRPWFAGLRLRLDAVREMWRERILDYNQDSQHDLLEMLKIPEPDGQKLVMVLAAAITLVFCWLTWHVRRELNPPIKDLAARAYARLGAKLATAGIPRMPHEGAEAYALRVARLRPDLGNAVTALCRQYAYLRYGAPSTSVTVGQFQAAVRAFRPKATA